MLCSPFSKPCNDLVQSQIVSKISLSRSEILKQYILKVSMDSETGEKFADQETGELPPVGELNVETGETEINRTPPTYNYARKKFKIPSDNATTQSQDYYKFRVNNMIGTNSTSACILFLFPTVLCFSPVVAIILGLIEMTLHIWAHKKNKTLHDKQIVYQSPLHIFVSEFCGACKDENTANKMTKLQDQRNDRFSKYSIEYFQRIVT